MQSKFKSKPVAAAVAAIVAAGFMVACGGGDGSAGGSGAGGVTLGGSFVQGLLDKAPFKVTCVADGSSLTTGVTAQGLYSITIDPTKCAGQVLIELDTPNVPAAGIPSAGPDNVFGTSDDEIYKPAERMPLKAISDLTGAKVGDSVTANLSAVTTGIANSALTTAGVDTTSTTQDIPTQLKTKAIADAVTPASVATATANIATALGLTQTTADYTKIDPRTNSELADKGTLLSAAVYAAVKGTTGKTAQDVVKAIVNNLNVAGVPAAVNGDITKLANSATDSAITTAITQAKTMIDAEALVRKEMVDSLSQMGVTKLSDIPVTKAALDALISKAKADTTIVTPGQSTTIADATKAYLNRQQQGSTIAAALTYLQTPPTPGTEATVLAKVTGIVNTTLKQINGSNAASTATTATQQDVFKNMVAFFDSAVATKNTSTAGAVPASADTPANTAKIIDAAQKMLEAALTANVTGTKTIDDVFSTPPSVGGVAKPFDAAVLATGTTVQAVDVSATTAVPTFGLPPTPGVDLNAAKILDPGVVAFTTTTKSAVAATDVLESDEITVANVNTPIPVFATGEGVTLVITNVSGVVTKLVTVFDKTATPPFKTPVGFVLKGDKVKLLIKSPAVAQTPNKVEVPANLTLLGKSAPDATTGLRTAVERTATLTVQGPAGVVPGAPTISAVTVSDGSATVTLTAPTSAGSASITEYAVTATPVGTGSPVTGTGTGTSITLTGLVNGTEYTFAVTATNGVGVSTPSASSAKFTPAKPPAAPTAASAAAGSRQAIVSFTAPTDTGGKPITGYTVTSNPGNISATGTSSPITVTGLTNGTAYTFTVTAASTGGLTSAASLPTSSVTPLSAAAAPTSVAATAGNGQATVTFVAPADNGGVPITGYTVVSNPAGGVDSNAGTTSLSHVITGLTNGTAYTFTVKATTSFGPGDLSQPTSSVSPAATVPTAPSAVVATAGIASASVAFTAPSTDGGSAITGYKVTSNPGNLSATGTSSPITVTGLTNDTAYTFTVVATNAKGASTASAASSSVTPFSVSGAPTGVVASAGNTTATVTFVAPANTGGKPITGYTVTSIPAGGVDTNADTTGLSHAITGLTNGTAYTFTVTAKTSAGTSAASSASTSVTPATVPAAPASVVATAGNGMATVAFAAPNNGGSAITGYTVTSTPGGFTGTGTTSPIAVSGLTNGTAYIFGVVATNAKGSSAVSAASNSVTPAWPPLNPTLATTAGAPVSDKIAIGQSTYTTGVTAATGMTYTGAPIQFGPYTLTSAATLTTTTAFTSFKINGGTAVTSGTATSGDTLTVAYDLAACLVDGNTCFGVFDEPHNLLIKNGTTNMFFAVKTCSTPDLPPPAGGAICTK